MINLLPPELASGYRYARRNVVLQKWVLALAVALIGLLALGTYAMLTLHQSTVSYNNQVSSMTKQLSQEHLEATEKKVQDISSSLKLAVQVLSKEVLFSKLIQQIGAVMPSGTVLSGLTINQLNSAINLTVLSTDYTTATQAQVNLSNPSNQIFSKVDINSIKCGGGSNNNSAYPCQTELTALFNQNNPFLFINEGNKP